MIRVFFLVMLASLISCRSPSRYQKGGSLPIDGEYTNSRGQKYSLENTFLIIRDPITDEVVVRNIKKVDDKTLQGFLFMVEYGALLRNLSHCTSWMMAP